MVPLRLEGSDRMDVYLDNAATSHPKPQEVLCAVQQALTAHNGNPGRSGHKRALAGARTLLECREALADHIGARDPFDIAFAFNCTDALNLAIKGSLRKGDHVIASWIEHNSVLRVLEGLRLRGQIDLSLVAPDASGRIDPGSILRETRPNTQLIVLTQASNVTGIIQPISEVGALAKSLGVRFLVDGAQGAGVLPVDVKQDNISLYAFPGHKGLLGPQGTGGLYITPDTELNTLREGGTGSSSESMRQPRERPERYESGTANLPGIAGLLMGARHAKAHMTEIRNRENRLTEQLVRGLMGISEVSVYYAQGAPRAAVVSFNIGDLSSGAVADELDRRGFQVRGGLHCAPGTHRALGTIKRGAVRASIGHANTPTEIDAFLREVHEIAKRGL